MPVKLKEPEKLEPVKGIRLACCRAGIYKKSREDLVLIEMSETSSCAAVFTKNAFAAAPVKIARRHLLESTPKYCVINAGNANAATGKRGDTDAEYCCQLLAERSACKTEQVLPFSTGVIGEYLPVEKFEAAYDTLLESLDAGNWLSCARAIMTTDIVAKGISKSIELDNKTVNITGIAKGSGMIRPDMATMLAFIATDAGIDRQVLKNMLDKAVDSSFNRITVDGDTSTNDACVLIATGEGEVTITDAESPLLNALQAAVNEVCQHLAQAIIRDGEGATKFIRIDVAGADSAKQCLGIAYDVANSPLVKTAMFASDPNWGRIIAAIGRSRAGEIDPANVGVFINELCVLSAGEKADTYSEAAGKAEMSKDEITLRIDLGSGKYSDSVWTCDFSHDYVTINADYRS